MKIIIIIIVKKTKEKIVFIYHLHLPTDTGWQGGADVCALTRNSDDKTGFVNMHLDHLLLSFQQLVGE